MKRASTWKRWLSLRGYGLVTSALFGATTPPVTMRARFERFGGVSRAAMMRKFPQLSISSHPIGELAVESVLAVEAPRCVIIHLHGGAFLMGSPHSYRNRAMRMSYRCHAEVFVPDYRLAPEHPYPAALEDALVTWQYVRTLRPRVPIFVTGDSAGGGLGLSLLVTLRELGAEMPSGAIFLSPWTDLTTSGASIEGNRRKDFWLTRRHLETWARHYVGDADAHAPGVSPVFADLSALPPMLVFAGEHEILLDDARRVVEAATRTGTTARLVVGKGMQHDWPLTLPWLDESRSAWVEIQRFIDRGCERHDSAAPPSGRRSLSPSEHASRTGNPAPVATR